MEESMRKRDRLYYLAVSLLAAALAAMIWYEVSHQSRELLRWQEESSALSRQELAVRESLRELYKDYSLRFREAAPGIVFWGDGYSRGEGRRDLAYQLNRQLENHLLADINYYLTRGIRNFNFHSLRIPMIRRGSSQEDFDTIASRAGVGEILLSEKVVLPQRTDPVTVKLVNESGKELVFAGRPDRKYRTAEIGGVEGYLYDMTLNPEGMVSRLAFGRKITGRGSETFPAGTRVILEDASKDLSIPTVLFFGESQELRSRRQILDFVKKQEAIVQSRKLEETAYIVVGRCEAGTPLDQAFAETFGEHYLRTDLPEMEETQEEDFEKLAAGIYEKLETIGCFRETEALILELQKKMEESVPGE